MYELIEFPLLAEQIWTLVTVVDCMISSVKEQLSFPLRSIKLCLGGVSALKEIVNLSNHILLSLLGIKLALG